LLDVSEFGSCDGRLQEHEVVTDEKDGTTIWNGDGAGGSETELLPATTKPGPTAWSDYQEDKPVREGLSWKQVSLIAAAILTPMNGCAL
jgi:hypothetical protein